MASRYQCPQTAKSSDPIYDFVFMYLEAMIEKIFKFLQNLGNIRKLFTEVVD